METKYKVRWLLAVNRRDYPRTAEREFTSATDAFMFVRDGQEKYNLLFEIQIGQPKTDYEWKPCDLSFLQLGGKP